MCEVVFLSFFVHFGSWAVHCTTLSRNGSRGIIPPPCELVNRGVGASPQTGLVWVTIVWLFWRWISYPFLEYETGSKNVYFTKHRMFTLQNFVSNCKTAIFTMFCYFLSKLFVWLACPRDCFGMLEGKYIKICCLVVFKP